MSRGRPSLRRRRRLMRFGGMLALLSMLALAAGTGSGAGATQAATAQPGTELRIDADEGLEWQRGDQVVIARGNARAVRGDLQVQARELRALYRDGPDGKSEIFRVIADGSVRLATANQTAFGAHAVYEVAEDRLLLTGGDRVRLISDRNEITADRSLEYWPKANRLVATGNAVAVQPDRQIYGDTITAYFAKGANGQSELSTADAVGNVKVVTPKETIFSDQGNYDAKSGIATVEGSVKIFRGSARLDGCRGQMDFNSGVSRLFACERPEPSAGRVRGRIQMNSGSGR